MNLPGEHACLGVSSQASGSVGVGFTQRCHDSGKNPLCCEVSKPERCCETLVFLSDKLMYLQAGEHMLTLRSSDTSKPGVALRHIQRSGSREHVIGVIPSSLCEGLLSYLYLTQTISLR